MTPRLTLTPTKQSRRHQRQLRTAARKRAKDFLRDLLANGPVDAKEGEEAARANGIKERTLFRARNELGVVAFKDGFKGGWQWKL